MALPHAGSGELIAVQHGDDDLSQFSAIALAKTAEMELIRMTLPKGKVMPEHHVPGEISLLCLRGEVALDAHGRSQALRAGQMVYLNGGQAHALRAEADSLLLLTILLDKGPGHA
ncbi:quercetin dioxygenase-like cupin family protein [Janthinobacterium sp. CG_23.3]|uniref:cupin domain-containing protein n=1 Tax=unclassified Janthinobacterium TaxID=2610881 RepID=UPI000379F93B|nr:MULTISPECIES: cupin domain-containing protein [unclassified Janthinobacterium]MEC5158942.1 quercetin dioxygenase-like cupin family protein [Janthinobacterium sp. CG_S6]